MTFPENGWQKYINMLSAINNTAAKKFTAYLDTHETDSRLGRQAAIDYAYAIATQYGESAAAAACEMYDAVAEASGKNLPAAEPAPTAPYSDVAKAVNGLKKQDASNDMIGDSIGRLVKRAGADTTLKNAKRDGAEFAWIPHGDTCAFCIMLASNGWQKASRKTIKGDHAEHIHQHCNCEFAIRFDGKSTVAGYDPDKYKEMWDNADGSKWQDKLKNMRHDNYQNYYAKNREDILAHKREKYASIKQSRTEEKATNIFGETVSFSEKMDNPKWNDAKSIINELAAEFKTKLKTVATGAEKAAGEVQISGTVMKLSSKDLANVIHEFAHTISLKNQTKFGLYDESEFWKEIESVRKKYKADVKQDTTRWISTYEHSHKNVDEFLAEAFTMAMLAEKKLPIPQKYGSDLTYANEVLEIIRKYFGK